MKQEAITDHLKLNSSLFLFNTIYTVTSIRLLSMGRIGLYSKVALAVGLYTAVEPLNFLFGYIISDFYFQTD